MAAISSEACLASLHLRVYLAYLNLSFDHIAPCLFSVSIFLIQFFFFFFFFEKYLVIGYQNHR